MKNHTANLVVALVLVAALGWVDYLTGTEVRAVLFYLVPIVFVAWFNGRKSVLGIAAASGIAWALAEFNLKTYDSVITAVWNELSALVVFSLVGLAIVHVRLERTELRAANKRINDMLELEEKIARTDVLTGLPNSREFLERLEPEVARCLRDHTPLCLLYFDLDNFKKVNDRYGHIAGDEVLRLVAQALRKQLRASDVPARLGGDEFAALLWQTTAEDAAKIGQRIVEAVTGVGTGYPDTDLGASVGVVWYDEPPADVNEVVKRADDAMYDAKKNGKRRTVVIRARDAKATT